MRIISILLSGLALLSIFSITYVSALSPEVSTQDSNESAQNQIVSSPLQIIALTLQGILEVLQNIFFEVEEIGDKNATINLNVTVEPPKVNVIGENEIAKRGTIVLREETNSLSTPQRVDDPQFVSLPNGACKVAIATDSFALKITELNIANNPREIYNCVGDSPSFFVPCFVTVNIDDEYFYIRIEPNFSGSYNDLYQYMTLAYDCST